MTSHTNIVTYVMTSSGPPCKQIKHTNQTSGLIECTHQYQTYAPLSNMRIDEGPPKAGRGASLLYKAQISVCMCVCMFCISSRNSPRTLEIYVPTGRVGSGDGRGLKKFRFFLQGGVRGGSNRVYYMGPCDVIRASQMRIFRVYIHQGVWGIKV